MNKEIANPRGFILITSIVFMFVCSSIIFVYFMQISHEHQRIEVAIAQAKAKYNARSGLAYEAYEKIFFKHVIVDTSENGEPLDSIRYFTGSKQFDIEDHDWFDCIEETKFWQRDCMGHFDSITVRIRMQENGKLVRYGYASGEATYTNILGKTLTLTDHVDITTASSPSLNTYMYLTANEAAGGAAQTMNCPGDNDLNCTRSNVTFGPNDDFAGGANGNFQSNGIMTMSTGGCPSFGETVTVTQNCDGTVNSPVYNGCFGSFNGEPPLDTAAVVCMPPRSFEHSKQFADYIFDSTELLVSDGLSYPGALQRDTLIMTELEFFEDGSGSEYGGFRVSRYKYLMPPHLDDFYSTVAGSVVLANETAPLDGTFLETDGYAGRVCTSNNTSYASTFACINNCPGAGTCEWHSYELCEFDDCPDPATCPFLLSNVVQCRDTDLITCPQYEQALNRYHAKTLDPLQNAVPIDFGISASRGPQHFDTHLYQYDPGFESQFEPTGNSENSMAISTNFYFPTEPTSIYIRGGPVLVHGTYKGRYTVITDDIMTYRRHAFPVNNASETPIDTIYCNIWLVDDLINTNAITQLDGVITLGAIQPNNDCMDGDENTIGLVSGANVIIANTRANGARGRSAAEVGEDGADINIHAHLIAFNESITIQYWQNSTLLYWNAWNTGGTNPTFLGDGNGLRYGDHTGGNDKRGIIYLWGGFVQLFRGYMLRNAAGPYNISPGIGMDKAYNWDDNQRCNDLPLYPEAENCSEECEINDLPDQIDFGIEEFRVF